MTCHLPGQSERRHAASTQQSEELRRERRAPIIGDDTQTRERNAMFVAESCDDGGFHVHRDRAGFLTESLLLARIANQFGRGQEPAMGTRQGRGVDPALPSTMRYAGGGDPALPSTMRYAGGATRRYRALCLTQGADAEGVGVGVPALAGSRTA